MTKYSHDVLFETFLDYFEHYINLKNSLAKKRKKENIPQEDFEELFYEEIDEVERQRDLLQKVFEEYIKKMLTTQGSHDTIEP